MKNLCGIDEAGRGPLAGPLVVAGVVLKKSIIGLNDSKKLSAKKRELLFDEIVLHSSYKIVFSDNQMIDTKGLSWCIKNSIAQIMDELKADNYLFDGNTSYKIPDLHHLIKADESVAEVSAASILAKVSRDRFMDDIACKYPNYNFSSHKGYGTKAHIDAIKKYGYSDLHRLSFKLKSEQPALF